MMFTYKLVRLIETHADRLARTLFEKVQTSPDLAAYRGVPCDELRDRVYEIYRHLGSWLLTNNEQEIAERYTGIGIRRAEQRVPLSQLIQAIVLTKENLWEYLKREALIDRPVEVFGELELLQMLEQFFDRAIYHAAVGYESVGESQILQSLAEGQVRS
jgi:hypothetical protein